MAGLYFSLISPAEAEPVEVDGTTYWLALRHKRQYKPYSIKLIDFRHDRYLGTDTPRNYSSQIQLVDSENNENREALIYMNNPLRYRGETFYQASFKQGDRGTVLQVVRNPGWLLPYIACTLGAVGMLLHFGMSLTRFLRRRIAA
jgi:cytochrome c biogenesis protein ResB